MNIFRKIGIVCLFLAILLVIGLIICGCSNNPSKNNSMNSEDIYNPLTIEFKKLIGDRIYFDYDSFELVSYEKEQIDKQVEWLMRHNNLNAMIEGHCDKRGTEEYNLILGKQRADAIRDYMIDKGIIAKRLYTISYGKTRPEVVGDTEDSWQYNRRGVISIQK